MSGLSHRFIPLLAGSAPTAGADTDYAAMSAASWLAEKAAPLPPPSADRSAGSSAPELSIGCGQGDRGISVLVDRRSGFQKKSQYLCRVCHGQVQSNATNDSPAGVKISGRAASTGLEDDKAVAASNAIRDPHQTLYCLPSPISFASMEGKQGGRERRCRMVRTASLVVF